MGWNLDSKSKDANVFFERPRTEDERKKLQGKRPDYVCYSKNPKIEKPIIIIEAKKPGENLLEALHQGQWYADQLDAPLIFATDGIYYKTFHKQFQKPLFLNGEEVDEFIRELEAIKFLENNELNTVSKEVQYSRNELIKIFEEANDLLRDEGLRAGIERFGEFANILFLKLLGEIEDLKEDQGESFIISRDLRWSSWKNKSGEELLYYVNDTVLKKMGEKYGDVDIFSPLSIKNPKVLKKIINKLEPLHLINIDSDIKGDSFEYFLKQSTATKNDLGEYFTPRHIVKTIVKLVNPQVGEKVYDPFCGTGGLLIESFKHIYNNMPRNPNTIEQLKKNSVFGNEITNTARITKMNMILAGDGHNNIQNRNSLKYPIDNEYDVIVTNMPYSQKTEYGNYYDLQSNNGDSVCIQHCIRALNEKSETSRMAIIVPEGFLFRKDMKKTREYLLGRCNLQSVISLPQGVFLPYTGVKTNILYCTDVKKNKKQEKFWYFEVKNDGYSLDNQRRKLEGEDDLRKYLANRNLDNQEKQEIIQVGFLEIKLEDVRKNDLILSGSRYKAIHEYAKSKFDMVLLSDIASFKRGPFGGSLKKEIFVKDGYKVYEQKHAINNNFDIGEYYIDENKFNEMIDFSVKPKDLIVSCSGTMGRIAIIPKNCKPGVINQALLKISPEISKIIPEYLKAILDSEIIQNKYFKNTLGTGMQNVSSIKNLKNIMIPLPNMKEQERIVAEVNGYQKVIEGAKQIINNYKLSVKAEDDTPIRKLVDCAEIIAGQSPDSCHYNTKSNGLPFYQGKSGFGDYYLKDPLLWTSKSTKIAEKDDILMSVRAPVGPVNIAPFKVCIGRGLAAIRPKNNLSYLYLFYYLYSNQHIINQKSLGSTFEGITRRDIEDIVIPLPSLEDQNRIVASIQGEIKLIQANITIIDTFEQKIRTIINEITGC